MDDFSEASENTNLNVRVITEEGDVIDFEATPDEVADLKERVYDSETWNWVRIEKDGGRIEGIAVNEVCAIRIRPYGRGEQFPDSKFVEFTFVGGGFIRSVCESAQATSLEHLLDDANGDIITWTAGAHEILIRSESILRFVIDKHEERDRNRPHYNDRDYDRNNNHDRNNRNNRYDNRNDRGGNRSHQRPDRRPRSARNY